MDRTYERRRRPQGHTQAQSRRQSPGRAPQRPPQRRSQPPRREEYAARSQHYREEYPARSRSAQPQRSRPSQPVRHYEEPRRRSYDEAPRYRTYDEAPRRAYDQAPRERRYEAPPRRRPPQAPQRRRYDAPARRPRREETFYPKGQNHLLNGLLVVIAAMVAVFCLYTHEHGGISLKPKEQVSLAETIPPTEPPTEAPTAPPMQVTPISSLEDLATVQTPDFVDVQIIGLENTSRRGVKLWAVNNIVLHYVGNPGSTAKDNRDWYAESNCDVNSHFVVGLQGEVIQCVPLDEKSSASNHRNGDTISIEICHPDESGKFNDATYNSVVDLVAWLLQTCNLDVEDVIRHYEVTGKICPKYYVENDDAWVKLRADIQARMDQ